MKILRFYFQGFKDSDVFLKLLLASFAGMWIYNLVLPKRPMVASSLIEGLLAYSFFIAIVVASIGVFLALENRAGDIQWSGCETRESREMVSKIVVRGGLFLCIVAGLI